MFVVGRGGGDGLKKQDKNYSHEESFLGNEHACIVVDRSLRCFCIVCSRKMRCFAMLGFDSLIVID